MSVRPQFISVRHLSQAVNAAVLAASTRSKLGTISAAQLVIDERITGFILRDVDLKTIPAEDLHSFATHVSTEITKAMPEISAGHSRVPGVIISNKIVTAGFIPVAEFRTVVE